MVETLTHRYTTQAEIERIWSIKAAASRVDDDSDGSTESELWNDVIDEATDEVNLYAENWYDPADMVNNKWVRRQASYIGAYFLSQRRGDPGRFHQLYERIIATLEKIRDGLMQIPRLGQRENQVPSISNYRVDDRYRIAKTRVQPTISTGGTSGNQHLDPTWSEDVP